MNKMDKKTSLFLIKVDGVQREVIGREISLLQQSGVKVKVLKKLK